MTAEEMTVGQAALARIDAHERVCAEQHRQIDEKLDTLRQDMSGVREEISKFRGRGFQVLLWLVVSLLSAVGYLMVEGPPWLDHLQTTAVIDHRAKGN